MGVDFGTLMISRKIFGKRVLPDKGKVDLGAIGRDRLCENPTTLAEQSTEIDMKQVAAYAEAMAKHRGYPDDAAAMIARRVVFLERRDLRGLATLHRELTLGEPFATRFRRYRPDGRDGGQCPFYAGIELESSFERLTAVEPEDRLWVKAPSSPLLLVPKLAEWLRPTGRRAMFWWLKNKEVPGYIVVEGFRLALYCKAGSRDALDLLQSADHIGFSACPDDVMPTPEPRSGFREKMQLQSRHIALMEEFLRSTQ